MMHERECLTVSLEFDVSTGSVGREKKTGSNGVIITRRWNEVQGREVELQ
jgi:hypothetical protein